MRQQPDGNAGAGKNPCYIRSKLAGMFSSIIANDHAAGSFSVISLRNISGQAISKPGDNQPIHPKRPCPELRSYARGTESQRAFETPTKFSHRSCFDQPGQFGTSLRIRIYIPPSGS
jgi:hypothetical protein